MGGGTEYGYYFGQSGVGGGTGIGLGGYGIRLLFRPKWGGGVR